MTGVIVQDHPLEIDRDAYRARALWCEYSDVTVGSDTFRGICLLETLDPFSWWLRRQGLEPSLTFFRKSQAGQREPHYIHHDAMMGDWTAILYLNPEPHPGDGTIFWEHKSGERSGDYDTSDLSKFTEWRRVKAQFNRAVIFPSHWFHSRALFENYGIGDGARLIQVAFGKVV